MGRSGELLRRGEQAAAVIADHCWPQRRQPRIGSVGLEAEMLPMRLANDGQPAGRVRLDDLARWLDDYAPQRSAVRGPPTRWRLPGRGSLTLEPGGQLEYSTRPMATAAAALDDLERVCGVLADELRGQGVALVSAGLDLWHPLADVGQQRPDPRYHAMHDYFERRGGRDGPGATMMRQTCALQVNLDLGGPSVAHERWLLANLMAPLAVASFATSPTADARSGRSLAWQRLDPTRSDALPARWRPAPVALLSGLLHDDRARSDALALMTPHRRHLAALTRHAARVGLADPALCALAVEVWSHGARAARRMPPGWLRPHHLDTCEQFVDRFVLRGRCPADELLDRMGHTSADAVAWAREPTGALRAPDRQGRP